MFSVITNNETAWRFAVPMAAGSQMKAACAGVIGVRSFHSRDNGELLDALISVGVKERVIILEGNAAVGIPVGAKHIAVSKQTGTAVDRLLPTDRRQPQCWNTVEQGLARLQLVNVRRRDAAHPDVGGTRIIKLRTEARMCFELAAIGKIDRVRGDVVDRRRAIIGGRSAERGVSGRRNAPSRAHVGGSVGEER